MPYINYDENGKITAQFACQQYDGQPFVIIPDDDKIYKYDKATQTVVIDTLKEFQSAIQYQHDAFNEYAREIVYQIQYNTALSNTTLILNLEEQLKAEQQAVISRINAITEAYNNAST